MTSPSTRDPDAVDVNATTLAQINVQVTYPASIIRAVPCMLRGRSEQCVYFRDFIDDGSL